MDRRDFIKISGAAAGLALTGCGPNPSTGSVTGRTSSGTGRTSSGTGGSKRLTNRNSRSLNGVEGPDYSGRIARDVEKFAPLNIKEITIDAGASKPFDVMHVSDTHITLSDDQDDSDVT